MERDVDSVLHLAGVAAPALYRRRFAQAERDTSRPGHGGAVGTAELEQLAAEVNGRDYEARLVAPQDRRPYLHVQNRRAGMLTENIYAGDGWFWWGWAERIAPITDLAAAVATITRVLRAVEAAQ